MAPSEMIGWECGTCTFTDKECMRRDCQMCATEHLEQYFIIAGASESASARTMTVDHCEQVHLATRSSNGPATGDPTAADGVAGGELAPKRRAWLDLLQRGIRINRACHDHHKQEHQSALHETQVEEASQEVPIAEGVPVLMGGCHHVPPPNRVA